MIIHGDCLEKLKAMDENSVDSVVTDPPYGLSFMGKKWDYDVPSADIWREVLRVLKPGGHVLSFGGTRTYHRMVVNMEDAGFEIRDQLQWLFGSGFPKSMDISKAIDKQAGIEREILGLNPSQIGRKTANHQSFVNTEEFDGAGELAGQRQAFLTAPATDEAKTWQGWGTALKPANEPICLARKPISEKTVAANVLKHGTGGLNIDASRISGKPWKPHSATGLATKFFTDGNAKIIDKEPHAGGRWPANLILDEEAAASLGEPSRFFYVAKASKKERNAGCEGMPLKEAPGSKRSAPAEGRTSALGAPRANHHPTVKPTKLMEYLIRLITPPNGTVLDPFMGSGSTGVAAKNLGFQFIGIEMNEEYMQIAKGRIGA